MPYYRRNNYYRPRPYYQKQPSRAVARRARTSVAAQRRLAGSYRIYSTPTLKAFDCYSVVSTFGSNSWTRFSPQWMEGTVVSLPQWNCVLPENTVKGRDSNRIFMNSFHYRMNVHNQTTANNTVGIRVIVVYAKDSATPVADDFLSEDSNLPTDGQFSRYYLIGKRSPFVILSDKSYTLRTPGDSDNLVVNTFKKSIKFRKPLIVDFEDTSSNAAAIYGGISIWVCANGNSAWTDDALELHTFTRTRFTDST